MAEDLDKVFQFICNQSNEVESIKQYMQQQNVSSDFEDLMHILRDRDFIRRTFQAIFVKPKGKLFINTSSFLSEYDEAYKQKWYESQAAERAFKDYPFNKKLSWGAIVIAGLALILQLADLIMKD